MNQLNLWQGVSVMFNMEELKQLIKLVDQSTLTEFQVETDDITITLKKEAPTSHVAGPAKETSQPQQPINEEVVKTEKSVSGPTMEPSPGVQESEQGLHKIVSPMVGTFYAAPAPDAPPYVQVGDKVSESTVVCIVEAMKLMNEIEAEVNGTIVEVLVENGQLVEYGQPLFLVKTE